MMNEKIFVVETDEITDCDTDVSRIAKVITDTNELYSYEDLYEVAELLNEQQATIINLQGDVNRLNYIIEELRTKSYKQFEKINELKAKLKEKQEDEKLYAQEIVKLNKEAKEVLNFRNLGSDY